MRKTVSISSRRNPKFKAWKKVLEAGGHHEGSTLACGARIAAELAGYDGARKLGWVVPDSWDQPLPGPESITAYTVPRILFKLLDIYGTGYPLLELDVSGRIMPAPHELGEGMFVALPLQDPANVGAVIRTAVGLGASGVITLPGCANPFHPRAVRASAGAVFRCRLFAVDGVSDLAMFHKPLIALDSGGTPVGEFKFPDCFVLVVGQEGGGLTFLAERLPVTVVSLPMESVESYNAAVAASLAMYEWTRQTQHSKHHA